MNHNHAQQDHINKKLQRFQSFHLYKTTKNPIKESNKPYFKNYISHQKSIKVIVKLGIFRLLLLTITT